MTYITSSLKLTLLLVCCFGLISGAAAGAALTGTEDPGQAPSTSSQPTMATQTTVVEPGDSIQTAVNQAASGDTIEIRPGTYEQSVTIDKQLTLVAPNGATLDGDAIDAEDGISIDAADVSVAGLEIRRFSDDGIDVRANNAVVTNTTVRLNDGRGIEADSQLVSSLTIESARVIENAYAGVYVAADGATVTITDSVLSNNDQGIETVDVAAVAVTDTNIDDNANHGATFDNAKTITANDTRIINNGDDGLHVPTSDVLGRTTTLHNVTARLNGGNGVDIHGTPDPDTATITESYIADNGDNGAYVAAESATVTRVKATNNGDGGVVLDSAAPAQITVTDSRLSANGGDSFDYSHGLTVADASQATITNVTANENYYDGIRLNTESTLDRSTVLSNVTTRLNGGNGLDVRGTADPDSFEITASTITNNDDNGLYVAAETIDVAAVDATENGDGGVVLDSAAPATVTIQDSDVSANGGDSYDYSHGLYIADTKQATIANVTANNNYYDGVRIESGTALGRTVTVTNTTARQNGDDGLEASGTDDPDDLTVANGTFSGNDDNGVVAAMDTVTVSQVTSDGNGDGGAVFLDGVSAVTVTDSSLSENGADDFDYETGLYIADATSVTVTDTAATNNDGSGVSIDAVDVASRTIQLTDVTANRNYDGILIASTPDPDTIEITDSIAENNVDDGIETAGSPVTIRGTVIATNADVGLVFDGDTAAGSTVHNSEFLNNAEHGIVNEDGARVNATGNWWGAASGPSDTACVGNVDCAAALSNPPGALLTLSPAQLSVGVNETATIDVVVDGAANGLSAYTFELALADTTAAAITGIDLPDSPTDADVTIGADNRTVAVDATMGAEPLPGRDQITLGTVTLTSSATGETALTIGENATVSDADGAAYDLTVDDGSHITATTGPAPVVGDSAPQDPNNDGVYEDVNGDGSANILDVQALFANAGSDSVQTTPGAFDFNGDSSVNILDVQALFAQSA